MPTRPRSKASYDRQQRRRFRKGGTSASLAPSPETLRALWAAAGRPAERLTLVLAARWGLRNGEVAHFNRSWWDDNRRAVEVPGACPCPRCDEQYARERTRWLPKTEKGERTIEVGASPTSVGTIRGYLRRRDGVYYSQRGIEYVVERLYRKAGLEVPRPDTDERNSMPVHGLRAAAAMRLASEIDNPMRLCAVMGWKDLTVAVHYIDAAKADALWGGLGPDLWEPAT